MTSLRQALPPVYRELLPSFFDTAPPAEEKATCGSCAMCPPPGTSAPDGVAFFRPDVKCCTYHPTLANYLVGALFRDPDPALEEGRRRMRARIASRIGITPRWVAAPRKYKLLWEASRERAFGRSLLLRCPYYVEEGGLCSIWRHREADCSTFFCKYDAGADGQAFWRGLNSYLTVVETALTRHALSQVAPELDWPDEPAGKLTVEDLEDRGPHPALYAAGWGAWEGREQELYARCHEVVSAVRAGDLPSLAGEEHGERLERLIALHARALSGALPERLVLDPELPLHPAGEGAIAVGYSRYEPVFLSQPLLAVLGTLTRDEPVQAAQARLRAEEIDLTDELLRTLHQARILIEPT